MKKVQDDISYILVRLKQQVAVKRQTIANSQMETIQKRIRRE